MSSRRRAKVTIRPSRLTADAIPRTLGTPNFCLKIGRRKTPKVAPSLATPAANPPVVPRNCVGDNIGTSVTVVELRPAFISHTCKTNGLHSNAAEPWNHPDSKPSSDRNLRKNAWIGGARLCSRRGLRQDENSLASFRCTNISPIDRYLVADAHRDDAKRFVVRGGGVSRFIAAVTRSCGFVKVTTMLLSNSGNSLAILRYKKLEQYQGRDNLVNSGRRSHSFRARDNHRS